MDTKHFIFFFVLSISGFFGSGKEVPKFPDYYSLSGTLNIPYAELKEPFQAWYSGEKGVSRIDYYQGMVKTYQLSNMGEAGTLLKVAPMTTEVVQNALTCFQVNGSSEYKVKPQAILPQLDKFKYLGMEKMSGLDCEKWRYIDSVGDKISKYTMWIRWTTSKLRGEAMSIPVKYEMKGYNSLLGSHYDHYYIDYETFSFDEPLAEVFDPPSNITCRSFPGPGSDHVYNMNPLKEFVEGYEDHLESAWAKFMDKHSRNNLGPKETFTRKEYFRQNIRYIHSKNRAGLGYQLSVNHLADKSDLELKALRGKKYSGDYNGGAAYPYDAQQEVKKLPESFDWRLFGAVTPVKDQSVCGSCWSFGTTGIIEGAYFIKTGHLLRLSQQALIDCSWGFGNNGCDGGEDFRSYQWMLKHGGLPLEDDYGPYMGQDGYCHIDKVQLVAPIKDWVNVTQYDEPALKVALFKHGPISIAIDASPRSFTFYNNGIYNDPACKNKEDELDHAVLLVGYGKLNGRPYWLVKNSWSTYWGNDGYILISPNNNICGVMTQPTYVNM